MIKLLIQLEHVASATPLARYEEAWTSAGIDQGTGPHLCISAKLLAQCTGDSPDTEECHESQNESYTNPSLNLILIPVIRVTSDHGPDDEVRSGHSDGTEKERWFSPDPIEH